LGVPSEIVKPGTQPSTMLDMASSPTVRVSHYARHPRSSVSGVVYRSLQRCHSTRFNTHPSFVSYRENTRSCPGRQAPCTIARSTNGTNARLLANSVESRQGDAVRRATAPPPRNYALRPWCRVWGPLVANVRGPRFPARHASARRSRTECYAGPTSQRLKSGPTRCWTGPTRSAADERGPRHVSARGPLDAPPSQLEGTSAGIDSQASAVRQHQAQRPGTSQSRESKGARGGVLGRHRSAAPQREYAAMRREP